MGRICQHRGLAYCLTSRSELDIREQGSVRAALDHHEPWAVINAAGFVRVADAEKVVDACLAANAAGASILAHECTQAGIPLITEAWRRGQEGGCTCRSRRSTHN